MKNKTLKTKVISLILILVSFCFVKELYPFGKENSYISFLTQVLNDSYKAMELMEDKQTGLPYDVVDSRTMQVVDSKVSPTEIGQWVISIVIAKEMGIIDKDHAFKKIKKILNTLENIETYNGFLYQWYDAKDGKVLSSFIPSIDNLNYDAALITAVSALKNEAPDISGRIKQLIKRKDYSFFYKKSNKSLEWLNHGFNIENSAYSLYEYGHFFTEIGLSIIPIIKGQIPEESLTTTQVPVKKCNLLVNQPNMVAVSWDGSLFNAFYPYLFIGYDVLPESIKINLRKYINVHIKKAEKMNIDYWGWSPAWGSKGDDYVAWGVPELADWGAGFGVTGEILRKGYNPEYAEVSAYSSFLVIGTLNYTENLFSEAIENLINIKKSGYGYNNYGFYDSINIKDKIPGKYKVSLDEGINIIGAYNALCHMRSEKGLEKYFWDYFKADTYDFVKTVFYGIGNKKFEKIKDAYVDNEDVFINKDKLVFIEKHSVDKGGWGFGLASCVSKDIQFEDGSTAWSLRYTLVKDFGGGYIKLNNLKKLNEYEYLVFKVKADLTDNTRGFQIELKESGMIFPPVFKYSVTGIFSDRWKEFIIPLNGVSEDKMDVIPSELTIVFDNTTSGTSQGKIYIKDLTFCKK